MARVFYIQSGTPEAERAHIEPLIDRMAPAYTVIIQLAGGAVAGIPGVIGATPWLWLAP